MAKSKTSYICNECGREHSKWTGQCSECGEWNTLEEYTPSAQMKSVAKGVSIRTAALDTVSFTDETRYDTGTKELNRVLGGGLVKGSLVLLSGDPGIGKSTLLLQICEKLGESFTVLYISGEESERQIKLRAERLGVSSGNVYLGSGTDCDGVVNTAMQLKPDILIVDSIQTMHYSGVQSSAGSVTQVRECTNLLMKLAKSEELSVFLVGHVNKDGGIAGPKVLEHIVDTVLTFEGDRQFSYRILRAVKNRFGSTNEIGVFEMRDDGLQEVENPSAMLLNGRPTGVSGISIHCAMEGSRPILAEVQALVSKTGFGQPRRVANGFDYNRLCLILAVLEKRTGFVFGAFDVYINVVGGLRLDEPAADVAIALALYSGLCDKVIADDIAGFGEIGLGGEIRSIHHANERVRECARLGFSKVIIPKASIGTIDKQAAKDIEVVGISNLKELFRMI